MIIAEEETFQMENPENLSSPEIQAFKREYVEISERIFGNLRNQLILVNQEKNLYEKLWRKTAHDLEKALVSKLKIKFEIILMILIVAESRSHFRSEAA
jgi:hypothetical protein